MDQSQNKILAEIETLEKEFKAGNKRKINHGLLAGLGTAIAGGALILAAPELLVDTVVLPTLNTMVLGNLGLTLTGMGSGYFLTNGKKEKQFQLSKAFQRRIDRHLSVLGETKNRAKINFIFNIESSLYPAYKKIGITETPQKMPFVKATILPLNMENYYLKIGGIFRGLFERSLEERPFVESISITHAEMTDEQFQHLLKFEIGCCGTTTLDLSKNRLTVLSIQALHRYIMKNKSSFLDLKSLNLSYNNLSFLTLGLIAKIVEHLGIEKLDLSGNDLNDTANNVNAINPELVKFLENQSRTMPSLKVLKLENIGLTNNFSKSLKKMLKEPSILTHLNIAKNPHLTYRKLQSLLDKGLEANQSIRELLLDHQEDLKIEDIFKRKDTIYTEMYNSTKQKGEMDMPRFVFILNRYCQKIDKKTELKNALSDQMNRRLRDIAEGIVGIRMKIFKLPEDYSIPITEKEFVTYMNNTIDNFYLHAIAKNDRKDLDERLFQKIEAPDPTKKAHQSSYDLDREKQEIAKKATLNDIKKPSVLKAI